MNQSLLLWVVFLIIILSSAILIEPKGERQKVIEESTPVMTRTFVTPEGVRCVMAEAEGGWVMDCTWR